GRRSETASDRPLNISWDPGRRWTTVPSLSTTRAFEASTLETVPICNGRAAGSATAGWKSNGCALRMNTDAPGTTEPVVTGCHTVVPGAIPMTRRSCSVIVPVAGSTFATMPAASTRGAPGAIDDVGAVVTNTGAAVDGVAMVPAVRGVGVMTVPADG